MSNRDSNLGDGKRLVLEAVDLVRLIGETVQLKRAGRRYLGLCPFHNEKTPSFTVDPARQFFYCFGCKKGGNAIDFVIARDRCDFITSLQTLAEWAGVELPRRSHPPEQSDKRKRLLDANSGAAAIYHKLLLDQAGDKAMQYLRERGFSEETIKRFGLGYAPDAWDTLARRGLLRKFPAPLLDEVGLLKRREHGEGYYDTFRDRVIFPIRDEQGRVIAFGGRVLPGGDNPAKYLNSPETPLFSKSRVLFGLDLAKGRIVETRTAIVFEGYADAVMAHQYGITNSVAVLGTSLTADHVQTLRRLADRIVLLFDADAAGGMAAKRSVELFLRQSVDVAVAELPAGMDPDEFLRKEGADAFAACMSKATDALDFYWRWMHQRFGGTQSVTGHEGSMREFLTAIAEARDAAGPIDADRWGAILIRLQKITGLRAADLNQRFARVARGEPRPTARTRTQVNSKWTRRADGSWRKQAPRYVGPRRSELPPGSAETAHERAEAHLLGALFNQPGLWHSVQEQVQPEAFSDRRYRWLAERFWQHLREEGEPSFPEWLGALEASAESKVDAAARAKSLCIELATRAEALGEPERVAAESVQFFQKRRGGQELDELLASARREFKPESKPGAGNESALLREVEQKVRSRGRA